MNISSLVTELSLLEGSFHDPAVTEKIAEVQKLIGVKHGSFAARFFFGHDDNWEKYSPNDKRDLLIDYVRQELVFVVADLNTD